jgi:hypothetical protein
LVVWLVGWWVGGLVGWWVGGLVGWWAGGLVGSIVGFDCTGGSVQSAAAHFSTELKFIRTKARDIRFVIRTSSFGTSCTANEIIWQSLREYVRDGYGVSRAKVRKREERYE